MAIYIQAVRGSIEAEVGIKSPQFGITVEFGYFSDKVTKL